MIRFLNHILIGFSLILGWDHAFDTVFTDRNACRPRWPTDPNFESFWSGLAPKSELFAYFPSSAAPREGEQGVLGIPEESVPNMSDPSDS